MEPVLWSQLSIGDTVYIDNYENGKFPKANPKVSGPFTVVDGRGRCLRGRRTFTHYPENLLRETV